jgi:hypothetical protein
LRSGGNDETLPPAGCKGEQNSTIPECAGMKARQNRALLVVATIGLAGFASPAFAYLDPSTGSMILSAIIGIFATLGLAVKTYWYKLKSLFRGSDPTPDSSPAKSQSENTNETGATGS